MNTGLKPCPFCGSRNVAQGASSDRVSVWCGCGARGPDVSFPLDCIDPVTPIKECHGLWNRRALPTPDAGDVGELVAEMRAGLEGVTSGPWVVRETTIHGIGYGGHWLELADPDGMIQMSGSGGARSYTMRVIDQQDHDDNEVNLRHFARCSPDNISKLLDHVSAQASRIKELEGERDAAREVNEYWADVGQRANSFIARAEKAEARLAQAVEALEPFAILAAEVFRVDPDGHEMNVHRADDAAVWGFDRVELTYGHLRAARTILNTIKKGDGDVE